MKLNILKPESDFKPVKLEITLETQNELNILAELGNYSDKVSGLLRESSYNLREVSEFLIQFYNKLERFRK